jgi:hypothetical protein
MTTNTNRSQIAADDLERVAAELTDAQADLDLLKRLKSAADRVARLTAERGKATKERDKALAAEAKAAEATRFAHISDIQVVESPETMREHVLRGSWTITYTRLTWNGRSSAPAQRSVTGFSVLPSDVLDYLIEQHPGRIPAKIIALAPDNPREAMARYFASLRRGFIVG